VLLLGWFGRSWGEAVGGWSVDGVEKIVGPKVGIYTASCMMSPGSAS